MAADSNEVKSTNDNAAPAAPPPPTASAQHAVAKQAPTEQQESRAGVPKRFATGQTVCSEKNDKGKLCNGHLKQMSTAHPSEMHLRGDDMLHKCQTCGALYMGPPQGHVRDPRKQTRYVQKDLAAILQAAGGTLPAYAPPKDPARIVAAGAPATKAAAPAAAKPAAPIVRTSAPAATPSGAGSSPTADRHRPAAEAQAATGQPSAAPMSPAAATASPAAGAETPADLAPEASTELTPGAPKDERPQADAAPTPAATAPTPAATMVPPPQEAAQKGAAAKKGESHGGFKVPAELAAIPPNETHAEKIERLKRIAEAAKRAAGKL
jgi:hypothetical protein